MSREQNILLLSFVSCLYLLGAFLVDIGVDSATMFNDFHPEADTFSFLDTGEALFTGCYSPNVEIRPFLFSSIVYILYSIGGAELIWFFQATSIILANYFLFKAIFLITNNLKWAIVGSILFSLNLSLVHVSFLALTEPLVVLGLSVLIYVLALVTKKKIDQGNFWAFCLAIFAVLTVIKPVFLVPFLAVLVLFIGLHLKNRYKLKMKTIIPVALALGMVLFQFSIMKTRTGDYTISKIGDITLKNYIAAQVISETIDLNRPESLDYIEDWRGDQVKELLVDEMWVTLDIFLGNVRNNIQSDPLPMDYYNPEINDEVATLMVIYNYLLYYILIMIGLLAIIYFALRRKGSFFPKTYLIILLLFYLVFVTGIAYGQRDRLMLPVAPIWIFILMFYLSWAVSIVKNNKSS